MATPIGRWHILHSLAESIPAISISPRQALGVAVCLHLARSLPAQHHLLLVLHPLLRTSHQIKMMRANNTQRFAEGEAMIRRRELSIGGLLTPFFWAAPA